MLHQRKKERQGKGRGKAGELSRDAVRQLAGGKWSRLGGWPDDTIPGNIFGGWGTSSAENLARNSPVIYLMPTWGLLSNVL